LKVLSRFADHIAVTFEDARAYLPSRTPTTVTGYPVRPDLTIWDREKALLALGLDENLPVLLVSGGSRGARAINRALLNLRNHAGSIVRRRRLDWRQAPGMIWPDLPLEVAGTSLSLFVRRDARR
jgi:UDP-N-acetylglucosamine:LPS N-acetylglucosamine transferase